MEDEKFKDYGLCDNGDNRAVRGHDSMGNFTIIPRASVS